MRSSSPRIALIAALDTRQAIGQDNALPWKISEDLKRFKALTWGKPIVMGRKTAQSLGRALPGRSNIVLSGHQSPPFEGMRVARNPAEALALAGPAPEVMVIGGGQVYGLFLPLAHVLHLTWVDTEVERPDAYFPAIDMEDWEEVRREEYGPTPTQPLAFRFVDYQRVR